MIHIAHIENDMTDKFGIPRQSGLVPEVISRVVFEPAFRNPDAVRGLEDFSHIWLIWEFDDITGNPDAPGWSATVRPPKLGGNTRMGVFATRSPNRPNPIGLSCVSLISVDITPQGPVLTVSGADLRSGTAILDIKPYLPYADSKPDAKAGFTEHAHLSELTISDPEGILDSLPEDKKKAVIPLLLQDPRPSYHNDPERIYGMRYGKYDIHFKVDDDLVIITDVTAFS